MSVVKFTLPMPPSVNAAYRNVPGIGRAKTGEVKAWAKLADPALKAETARNGTLSAQMDWVALNKGRKVKGRQVSRSLAVRYDFSFACTRPRDLANFEKIMTDFLVDAGVIISDAHIDFMVLRRRAPGKNNVDVAIKIY